jgi:hypothetical protein
VLRDDSLEQWERAAENIQGWEECVQGLHFIQLTMSKSTEAAAHVSDFMEWQQLVTAVENVTPAAKTSYVKAFLFKHLPEGLGSFVGRFGADVPLLIAHLTPMATAHATHTLTSRSYGHQDRQGQQSNRDRDRDSASARYTPYPPRSSRSERRDSDARGSAQTQGRERSRLYQDQAPRPPPMPCFSRASPTNARCSYATCRFDHRCLSCGSDHAAVDCPSWNQAVADAAFDAATVRSGKSSVASRRGRNRGGQGREERGSYGRGDQRDLKREGTAGSSWQTRGGHGPPA